MSDGETLEPMLNSRAAVQAAVDTCPTDSRAGSRKNTAPGASGAVQIDVLSSFFPRSRARALKREYPFIRQRASENSTEYMHVSPPSWFLGQAAVLSKEQAKNCPLGDDYDKSETFQTRGTRVETPESDRQNGCVDMNLTSRHGNMKLVLYGDQMNRYQPIVSAFQDVFPGRTSRKPPSFAL
ncbi:hypothetical protein Tco_0880923 [Tanacetum coccineum]